MLKAAIGKRAFKGATVRQTALFTIVNTWEQPKCPLTDERVKKKWCIY